MSTFGDFKRNIGLSMAGKSPWGTGSGSGDGESGTDSGGEASGESSADKPKGPRNPWLPGGSNGSGSDGPRRSANVEDIFKKRRGGGGGSNGGGDGPNFRLPERPGGKSWMPIVLGLIVVAGLATTSLHLVAAQEQAVVKTLGNYTRTLSPGLHLSAPYPVETVDVVDVQGVRTVRIPESGEAVKLILTGDQNLVDLSYIVRWNINDLEDFKFRLVEPVETVNEAAEAAMRAAVAEKELDETFTGQGRAAIELDVRERMQATLDSYQAGIRVLGVEIEKADPPAQVVEAFRDVQVAEQNADAARNRAQGYAQQVLATAQGEAQAFDKVYEEYRLAPEVTRQRMYYETMERVLRQTDKTVIGTDGVTPYLPLPEVRRRSTTPPPTAAPAPTPAPAEGGQ